MTRSLGRLASIVLVAGMGSAAVALKSGQAVQPAGGAEGQVVDGIRAFINARIIDGTGGPLIEDGVVVVRDGIISAVGPVGQTAVPGGAEVVDLEGRWLAPGLVNAHGHVRGNREAALEQLELYAHYGVTTVVSLADDALDFMSERSSPQLRYARVYVSGPSISPTTPEEARETVAGLAARNVDWVKSHLNPSGRMPRPVYEAMIAAARERNIPVAVHIEELAPARGAVEAGASLVAHSVRDVPVDQGFIDLMRERGVCLVPTLTRELSTFVFAERPAFFDDPFFLERAAPPDLEAFLTPQLQAQSRSATGERWRQALPLAMENMRRLHEAGVGIAMGTDTGPVGRFQGYFEHVELEMMVDGGLTPADALLSATGRAARCVGLEGVVGTIQPGAWGDFLVLDANPLEDIRNTRSIHSVWIAGNSVRSEP